MRRLIILTPAFIFVAACGGGPTEQEENLSERANAPEQMTSGDGNIAPGTAPATEQGQLGDTMPDNAAGPVSDQGSGTGGDSVPSQ